MDYCDCGDNLEHNLFDGEGAMNRIIALEAELERVLASGNRLNEKLADIKGERDRLKIELGQVRVDEARRISLVQRNARLQRELGQANAAKAEAIELAGYYASRLIEKGLLRKEEIPDIFP